MKYSEGFKNNILKQILPPGNKQIVVVAKETGVHVKTIRYWLNKIKNDTNKNIDARISPEKRSIIEKLSLLLDSKQIPENKRGEWLRSNGLHTEHPQSFEQEIRMTLTDKDSKMTKDIKKLKLENIKLQKELDLSQKALGKASALLMLKKKVDAIWGENEDD